MKIDNNCSLKELRKFLKRSSGIVAVFKILLNIQSHDLNSNIDWKSNKVLLSIISNWESVIMATGNKTVEMSGTYKKLRSKRINNNYKLFEETNFIIACGKWLIMVQNTPTFCEWLNNNVCERARNEKIKKFNEARNVLENKIAEIDGKSTFEIIRIVGESPMEWTEDGISAFQKINLIWEKFTRQNSSDYKILKRLVNGESVPLFFITGNALNYGGKPYKDP